MKKLILHPTDTSQWHALVNEAQAATQLVLAENTESYLVFLLMRYMQAPQLLESVLALDLLETLQVIRKRHASKLRDVGDKSLLFCGLFPGMAQRRNVQLTYFADLGQAAYQSAGELEVHESASLYFALSAHFLTLQQILQAMRMEWMPQETLDSRLLKVSGNIN